MSHVLNLTIFKKAEESSRVDYYDYYNLYPQYFEERKFSSNDDMLYNILGSVESGAAFLMVTLDNIGRMLVSHDQNTIHHCMTAI